MINDQYEKLLSQVMTQGVDRPDRTGTGTRSIFGAQMRFDLNQGFPVITTKKIHWKSVVEELLWFLSGSTNVRDLQARGVRIWDEWAREDGDLGPIYGAQWRSWPTESGPVDQITGVIDSISRDPYSRRLIVNSWNVSQLASMSLTPCHAMFQFYVSPQTSGPDQLSLHLYQRSADMFLGVPFNIASYALLTHMVAQVTGLSVGEFVWTGGDVHIYHNHFDAVRTQLARDVRPFPTLSLRPRGSVFDYVFDDARLVNYDPHPLIPGKVAV